MEKTTFFQQILLISKNLNQDPVTDKDNLNNLEHLQMLQVLMIPLQTVMMIKITDFYYFPRMQVRELHHVFFHL